MNSILLYNLNVVLGLFFVLYAFFKHPDLLKADKTFLKKWMILISLFLISSNLMAGYVGDRSPYFIVDIWNQGINQLLGVFWEEGAFVIPFLLIYKRFPGKKFIFFVPLMIVTSLYFAAGHSYQGGYWPVFAIVPFLSLWLSVKKGAGTSMILHVFYDVSVITCNYLILKMFS